MERQNPAAPWSNRVPLPWDREESPEKKPPAFTTFLLSVSFPSKKSWKRCLSCSEPRNSRLLKNKGKRFPKESSFPNIYSHFWAFLPAAFSHIPGVQDMHGRGQGWVAQGAFQDGKPGDPRLPELIPSPDSVGNWDLGGGKGIEGGHGSGSAPSVGWGDVFFGNPNIWDEQTHP